MKFRVHFIFFTLFLVLLAFIGNIELGSLLEDTSSTTTVEAITNQIKIKLGEKKALASCNSSRARQDCCPNWCEKRKQINKWKNAETLSKCAKNFGCSWTENNSEASYYCATKCQYYSSFELF